MAAMFSVTGTISWGSNNIHCCKRIVILIKALLIIGAVVNYGECARDPPEGTWDFPIVIQMNMNSI